MCADSTQVDYEYLAQIVRQFYCESESITELEHLLRREVETLCARQWFGQASESFQREMTGRALPGLRRLAEALMEASQAADQIGRIYHDHEEEAAGLFKGLEAGSAAGERPGGSPGAAGGQAPSRVQGEAKLKGFEYDVLKTRQGVAPELGIKYGIDRAYYERKGDDGFDIFGGGGGVEAKLDKKGLAVGPYLEGYLVKGDVDGVLGNDRLGLVGGVGTNLVSGEAFAGVRRNSIGATVGFKLATLEGKLGANIAGININLFAEAGAKMEAGFTIGAKTQIKAPFLTLGISIGMAEAR